MPVEKPRRGDLVAFALLAALAGALPFLGRSPFDYWFWLLAGALVLNLAQAVLLLGYELLMAAGAAPEPPAVRPAPQAELAGMYADLADLLLMIGFLPADNPEHWLMNIKKIFNRSLLTSGECNLWRGVCRQARWALANPDRARANWERAGHAR